MSRSALFVIDIQGELAIDPKTRIPHAERIKSAGTKILAAARNIIDSFRDKGEQSPSIIVFVQHEDKTMVKGSDLWKLVFDPRDGVSEEILVAKTTSECIHSTTTAPTPQKLSLLLQKYAGNTFETNPGLADKLKAEGVAEVVTFGIQSECCVLETSKGALEHGFSVTLLQGAHSTYDSPPKSAVEVERDIEDELRQKGAQIIPWEDAIATWEQRRMISTYPIFSELR